MLQEIVQIYFTFSFLHDDILSIIFLFYIIEILRERFLHFTQCPKGQDQT